MSTCETVGDGNRCRLDSGHGHPHLARPGVEWIGSGSSAIYLDRDLDRRMLHARLAVPLDAVAADYHRWLGLVVS